MLFSSGSNRDVDMIARTEAENPWVVHTVSSNKAIHGEHKSHGALKVPGQNFENYKAHQGSSFVFSRHLASCHECSIELVHDVVNGHPIC